MTKTFAELIVILSVEDSDSVELDTLTHQLKREIDDLEVESVENVSTELVSQGGKAADWISIGQIVVTLAPSVVPHLFDLIRSWIERKPSTPVKIKIRMGKKTAQIEYDPTRTTAEEIEALVKTLKKSMKK